MRDLNMVLITGRLTKDAEVKYTGAGDPVAGFSLAVNHSRKDKSGQWIDEADYIDCKLWGKTATNLQQYLVKGKKVLANGEFRQEKWTDQQGTQHSRIVLNITMIQLMGSAGEQQGAPVPAGFNDDGIPF